MGKRFSRSLGYIPLFASWNGRCGSVHMENEMGTGGVKSWAQEANKIAEKINFAFQVFDYEFGDGKNVPKLMQISAGEFTFKCFGKDWLIRISLKDK